MTHTTVEWVSLAGQRYAVQMPDESGGVEYRPFQQPLEPDALEGLSLQPPYVDGQIKGFATGEGLATAGDEAAGYLSAQGFEPHTEVPTSGNLRLKVGRSFAEAWAAVASAGGYVAMALYDGKLFALRRSAAIVDEWDGTTRTARDWSGTASLVAGSMGVSLISFRDVLYIGTDKGQVLTWNRSVFAIAITASTSEEVHFVGITSDDNTAGGYLHIFNNGTTSVSGARRFRWDGTTIVGPLSTHPDYDYTAGIVLGETLYFTLTPRGSAAYEIWTADATVGEVGATRLLGPVEGNYLSAVVEFEGALYWSTIWGGLIFRLDGIQLIPVGRFGASAAPATLPGTDAIFDMLVFGDSLYAPMYDASAPSGMRTVLRRYTGEAGGWHPISVGGNDLSTAIRSIAVYNQGIFLGDSEASNGRVYELSKTNRLLSAGLTGPDFDYGAPASRKRYVWIRLPHDPLVAGQTVAVSYQLDGAAAVALGTNKRVGSTETVFQLPADVIGTRLRPVFTFTNLVGSDLVAASIGVRVLPTQGYRNAWELTADLANNGDTLAWSDGLPDHDEALDKLKRLTALQVAGEPFQLVGPFRDLNGRPTEAARVAFDASVPLYPEITLPNPAQIAVPLRLLEMGEPENLVLNASFEQDADGVIPTDWGTLVGTVTSAVTDDAEHDDSAKSLKVTFNGAAATGGRSQAVAGLVPGRWHALSVAIKRATTAGTVVASVSETGVLNTQGGIALPAGTDVRWNTYPIPFWYPSNGSGTVTLTLAGIGTPVGHVWFDAAEIHEGVPAESFRERGAA